MVNVGALGMAVGLYGMWEAAGHGAGWLVPGLAVDGIVFYRAADLTGGFRAGLVALIVLELTLVAIIQLLPRK